MNNKTVEKLLALNKSFYETAGNAFSRTRNYGWPGWKKLLKDFQSEQIDINNVLDLACGNGRFLDTLRKYYPKSSYIGVDDSEILLHEAELTFHDKHVQWILEDVLNNFTLNAKFDLVCCFGFLHHIPSFELRNSFLLNAAGFLSDSGYLVISLWDFLGKKYEQRNAQEELLQEIGIEPGELESNDFILDWRSQQRALRYAHAYDDEEITELLEISGLSLIREFYADGRDGKSNRYLIIKPKRY
jgi:SAM-dependent methyltransferase